VQAALQNTQAQGAQIYDLMKLLAQHVENQASAAGQSAVQDQQVRCSLQRTQRCVCMCVCTNAVAAIVETVVVFDFYLFPT